MIEIGERVTGVLTRPGAAESCKGQSTAILETDDDERLAVVFPSDSGLPKLEHLGIQCTLEGTKTPRTSQLCSETSASVLEVSAAHLSESSLSLDLSQENNEDSARSVDGELVKMSSVQMFQRGQPTVLLSLSRIAGPKDRSDNNVDGGSTGHSESRLITVLLQGEATGYRPFLHLGERYRFLGVKRIRLRHKCYSEREITPYVSSASTRIETLKYRWCGQLVDYVPDVQLATMAVALPGDEPPVGLRIMPAGVVTGSDTPHTDLSTYLSPSPADLYAVTHQPMAIECCVEEMRGPWAVAVTATCGGGVRPWPLPVTLLMSSRKDSAIAACLRPGACLQCSHVFPVYTWGLLTGFYLGASSHIQVLRFSRSRKGSKRGSTDASKRQRVQIQEHDDSIINAHISGEEYINKCAMYQSWVQLTHWILNTSCIDQSRWPQRRLAVSEALWHIRSAVPAQLEFGRPPASTAWIEFSDDQYACLNNVRGGNDADWLGVRLPEVLSARDLRWSEDELGTYMDSRQHVHGEAAGTGGSGPASRHLLSPRDLCILRRRRWGIGICSGRGVHEPGGAPRLADRTFVVGELRPMSRFGREGGNDKDEGQVWVCRLCDAHGYVSVRVLDGMPVAFSQAALVVIADPWVAVKETSDKKYGAVETILVVESTQIKVLQLDGTQGDGQDAGVSVVVPHEKRSRPDEDGMVTMSSGDTQTCTNALTRRKHIRDVLLTHSAGTTVEASIIGVVVYLKYDEKRPVMYLRDMCFPDFIACYCDADLPAVADAVVGAVLTLSCVRLAQASSGRLYLTALAPHTSVAITDCVSLADMSCLLSRARTRPDALYPVLHKHGHADPTRISKGQRPAVISLATLRAHTAKSHGAAHVAWSVRGHCVHINHIEVRLRCAACNCSLEHRFEALHKTRFLCLNPDCELTSTLLGQDRPRAQAVVAWEAQAKFDDGSGEVLMYLHDDDFFSAVSPCRPQTYGVDYTDHTRRNAANAYAAQRFEMPAVHKGGRSDQLLDGAQAALGKIQKLKVYLECAARSLGRVSVPVEHQGSRGDGFDFPDPAYVPVMDKDRVVDNCRRVVALALGKARHRQVCISAVVRVVRKDMEKWRDRATRQINVQQTYAETFLLEGRKPLLCNKPSDMEIHDTLKHIIDPAAMAPTNAEILLRKVGQIFRSQARIPAMERLELKTT